MGVWEIKIKYWKLNRKIKTSHSHTEQFFTTLIYYLCLRLVVVSSVNKKELFFFFNLLSLAILFY